MDLIFLKIRHNGSSYGKYVLTKTILEEYNLQLNDGIISKRPSKCKVKLHYDGIFLHYFVRELRISNIYRASFISNFKKHAPKQVNTIKFNLIEPVKQIIDYEWNYRMEHLMRERCELENALSWLSTLGGAFSALGDYYLNCAEIAGKISVNQFKLALRLRDESVIARCKLFLSLSLIQQKRFRLAKHIIHTEYVRAKNAPIIDNKLLKMCKGIWAKLQYEHKVRKKIKKAPKMSIKI